MKHSLVRCKKDVMAFNVPDTLIVTWYELATEGYEYDVQRRALMMLQDAFGTFEAAEEYVFSSGLSKKGSSVCAA